jgi:hypothetical protein
MEITVIEKLSDGYIVMASNGETAFISNKTYSILKAKGKIK